MAFTTAEIREIKQRLGYGNMTLGAAPYFEVTAVFEDVVAAYTDAYGEGYVRDTVLVALRLIDTGLSPSTFLGRRKALKVKDVELNPHELDDIEALRDWWLDRLSETLGVARVRPPGKGSAVVLE